MKTTPAENWTNLVKQIAQAKKCDYMDAWRHAANAYPDAALLMSAFGRTRQSAISFFNSLPIPAACGTEFANELAVGTGKGVATVKGKATRFVPVVLPGADLRRQPAAQQFSNASDDQCPVGNHKHFALFRLPMDTPQDVWCAAWKGNGKTISPVNYGKAFAGIVDYLQTQKGSTYEAALASAKTLYPDMWAMVQAIAEQPV